MKVIPMTHDQTSPAVPSRLSTQLPRLRELLAQTERSYLHHLMSKFYRQGCALYEHQAMTEEMVSALASIAPEGHGFCIQFQEIIRLGTGREFKLEDNNHWTERAGAIVQAFLHARYFLEMAVRYATELSDPPERLPSGWCAMCNLFDITDVCGPGFKHPKYPFD